MTAQSAAPLTEAVIEKALRQALAVKGFRLCYHTRFAVGSDTGFPDLVAVRDGALVALEVKGPRGRLRPNQADWIAAFRSLPGCVLAAVVGPEPSDHWLGYDQILERIGAL
jgi:hypothetical protein